MAFPEIDGPAVPTAYIAVANDRENYITPLRTDLEPAEVKDWQALFSALNDLDFRFNKATGFSPSVIVSEIGFDPQVGEEVIQGDPQSLESAEDEDEREDCEALVIIRPSFIDPLTHNPGSVSVALAIDGEVHASGVCNATWNGNKVTPNLTQYHLLNAFAIKDFLPLLETAAERIRGMQPPSSLVKPASRAN